MPILFLLFLALPIAAAFVCDTATFAMLMVPYLGIAFVKLSSLNNLDRFLDGETADDRNRHRNDNRNSPQQIADRDARSAPCKT